MAVTVVVTKAEVTRAVVMNMVKVNGRDGEGDDGVFSDGAGVDLGERRGCEEGVFGAGRGSGYRGEVMR